LVAEDNLECAHGPVPGTERNPVYRHTRILQQVDCFGYPGAVGELRKAKAEVFIEAAADMFGAE
jgi:hypothetical protein